GHLLWRLELGAYDARLASRPSRFTDQIVIVAVDNESLKQERNHLNEWPWSRAIHGKLLDLLHKDGARLVGMDILFDSPSDDPEADDALAGAMKRCGNVILAGQLNQDTATRGEEMASGVSSVSFPYEPFADTMLDLGLTNIPRDPDASVRRAWLVRSHQDEPYYTLPVMLAAYALKRDPGEVAAEGLRGGYSDHPYLGNGTILINYAGPAGTIKYVPYYQVLEGITPAGTFRDKIVLVGGTAEILQDIYPTPMARVEPGRGDAQLVQMPGVEVQANALLMLLQGSTIRPAAMVVVWGVTALLALLVAAGTVFLRPLRAGLLTLVVLVTAVVGTFLLMWQMRLWLPLVPLLLGGLLAYLEGTVYMYLTEERARLRLRRAWQQRVSAEVLQVILDNPVPKVQGRRIDATVMFSDLRGFTTMCSTSAPEYVVERLNDYLTAMTQVIREFGGTIHKFIGDGIMAVFGDPVPHADHAARAVRAAVAMQRRMIETNAAAEAAGQPPLHMGIGIHSGELVAGDIGSEALLEYTVIGDTVSTSSRIEGLNKGFKTGILVSGQTVRAMGETELPLKHLGTQGVRGRAEELELYTVDLPELQLTTPPVQEKRDP
ncbi:MAG: adenylate/guanylate cyclase domain-containing protein, partial [Armatimonadetes bacterium]|nr:adenylate/guanylate cyclase domain-containing protein [Armatimonadota bacterium]